MQAYAVGLIGFSYVKVLVPAFIAREDTKTPVKIGIVALVVIVVLSVASAWYLTKEGFIGPHVGLATGNIGCCTDERAAAVRRAASRRRYAALCRSWLRLLLQVAAGNAAMWALLEWLHRPLDWWLDDFRGGRDFGWLGISVAAGAAILLCNDASCSGCGRRQLRLKH